MTPLSTYAVYAKHRDAKGLKDYYIAQATGIAPSTMSEWKHGIYTPGFLKLVAIAKFLGFPVEEFAA